MLALPTYGLSQPTGVPPDITHNIKLEILCDWIEGSALFDEEIFTTDVVDVLMEEDLYTDRDLALDITTQVWNELKRRLEWMGEGSPFCITRRQIRTKASWKENPAHSFCILLSMPQCYEGWSTCLHRGDYIEQGKLFEQLTKASIEAQFSDWKVHQTAWSPGNAQKLSDIVEEIIERLGEKKGEIEPWENPDGKEAGLDLLCYRPFPDQRVGVPVYLMQCASGKNWIHKLYEPDLNVWTKIIMFAARPRKAFAIPFALREDEFKKQCNRVDGMLLDRYRLLAPAEHNRNWVPNPLKNEIINWIAPRIQTLPRYKE